MEETGKAMRRLLDDSLQSAVPAEHVTGFNWTSPLCRRRLPSVGPEQAVLKEESGGGG